MATKRTPSDSTILITSAGLAPRAIRRPISAVRWLTANDTTPYTPAIASATASAAKMVSKTVRKRGAAVVSDRRASMVVNFTGISGAISRAFRRNDSESCAGGMLVRATMLRAVEGPGCCS